ncbi:MAG: Crp/Fnr family transcriptional regulator, partial [Gammaproteobacteria bacterium]
RVRFFEEHKNIISKGDVVGGIYLVLSGCLRVYTVDANGRESTLYEVLAGESCLLAMNCMFSELLYPAWVNCASPLTKVAVIPAPVYRVLYDTERSVRNFTFEVLSQRLFNIMSALEEALSFSVEQRLASYLLRKAGVHMKLAASHQAIALELGTAREVVSRILKKMEKAGCLSLSRGSITIHSVTGINRYVGG